jgi:hypothetical protein
VTNSGIPVFATTVTRDAAFGGTGEKTLAEGQFAYIEATDTTQYYNGSSWLSVGTSPGLVVVKAETAFSAASSITADSVFSSTYRNYTIKFTATASTGLALYMKLRVGGVSAATNYNFQGQTTNNTTVSAGRSASQTQAELGSYAADGSSTTINLYNPASATATTYDSLTAYPATFATPITNMFTGNHSTATAYDGIEFTTSSGTLTGSYTIYAWSK